MSGLSDVLSNKIQSPGDLLTAPITQGLKSPGAIKNTLVNDNKELTGQTQKARQLAAADANAPKPTPVKEMPVSGDAASQAALRRKQAALLASSGRASTILSDSADKLGN